ncbi:transposase [Pantoea agglomerans]
MPHGPCNAGHAGRGIKSGIFCALHTCGRLLNQHPQVYVSVTHCGFDVKHGIWRALFFKKRDVEAIWRGAVIRLLRQSYVMIYPGGLPGAGPHPI